MTVTWTKKPAHASVGNKVPRVNTTQFGDGYTQRAVDGLNALAEMWSLTFEYGNSTDRDADDTVLVGLGGISYFNWTPPFESTPKKYTCGKWSKTQGDDGCFVLQAEFMQVFDL